MSENVFLLNFILIIDTKIHETYCALSKYINSYFKNNISGCKLGLEDHKLHIYTLNQNMVLCNGLISSKSSGNHRLTKVHHFTGYHSGVCPVAPRSAW